jgi:phosphonate transport system substrate-binding protein
MRERLREASCILFVVVFVILLTACDQALQQNETLQYRDAPVDEDVPVYRFAVHPLHNPKKLSEAYQPLIDHLNGRITGMRLELEASRDYQAYEQKFRAREPEFLLPNPWQTLEAIKVGYQVIAMAGDAEDFKGIFIVRKDSAIRTPADLRGGVVSYPSPTALAAAIMPQYFLHNHGIDINRDLENHYVGSQESSIMHVYLGESTAGATWPPPWRLFQKDHPAEAVELEQAWETPPLLNNSVMVRDDVLPQVRNQVRDRLLELASTPEGPAILGGMETARFQVADDASYNKVQEYITRFEREVRPVEQK